MKSDAIKDFLTKNTHADLASLYSKAMEVQVNVAQDGGEALDVGRLGSRSVPAYTDGLQTWKAFRIPLKAMSEPEDNDGPMGFNLDEHVEGIGMTGWDWQTKRSLWVAYDFDSMLGHSESHSKKLSQEELTKIQEVVTGLPYVTVRRSTSGRGLHLYIFLDPIYTENHTEHAALARSILSMIAGITGYNFTDKVDICGSNMWVWHRKMLNTEGLTLIRQGETLKNVPPNWRDHVNVITRKRKKVELNVGIEDELFNQMSGQRSKVKLDAEHMALVKYLEDNNLRSWWDADNHMLVTHTAYLKEAYKVLKMRGEFDTVATGTDYGNDVNGYAFPIRGGGWAVRRYGHGTKEKELWVQDGKAITKCHLNRELTLEDVARLFGGVEMSGGGYQFKNCEVAGQAMLKLGVDMALPTWLNGRIFKVKESKSEYKFTCLVPHENSDDATVMVGWLPDRGFYKRIYRTPNSGIPDDTLNIADFDNTVRHIVNENGEDLGWKVCGDTGLWRNEPINHVKVLLKAQGLGSKEIDIILGKCVSQPWIVVNRPFEIEYPGDRQWNKSLARFKIAPSIEGESLTYPTWTKILAHCGTSLDSVVTEDEWCKRSNVNTGADYLFLWYACLSKFPQQPLPYLALHGPQDSGKSTLHEAFCQLLLAGGYIDGATALNSSSNFNGELEGTILCPLEEIDLRKKETYNRLKDWITSPQLSLHIKGQTPFRVPNYTHWIQCVNNPAYIPVFEGDKRVVVLYVEAIPQVDMIPKRDLWVALTKEAPDFLAALLNCQIPDSRDRLMLPVLTSSHKLAAEYDSLTDVERFMLSKTVRVDGAYVSQFDLHEAFKEFMGDEGHKWGRIKFAKEVPNSYIKGRIGETKTQDTYYGNLSLNIDSPPQPTLPWFSGGVSMIRKRVPSEKDRPAG